MPEWLARPASLTLSSSASAAVKPQDNSTPRASVAGAVSKGPETISIAALKATMETAERAVATVCAGHEKSCLDMAARAAKASTETDPLAALIGPETAHAASSSTRPENQMVEAIPVLAIPLPPRREPVPQKKI